MAQSNQKSEIANLSDAVDAEAEIAYLAKRHRVSPAIVREIMRRSGSAGRAAIEREIEKGRSRR